MLTSEVRPAEARFELTLAFHCAPALAGIKPADLIALPGEGDETDALLASYSAALAGAVTGVLSGFGIGGGSLLLIPMACSLFGISNDIAMQVVGIGFVIGVIQDSVETAINSSTDVLFAASAEYMQWRREGRDFKPGADA